MKLGFFSVLFLILLVLKLTGVLVISWGWLITILCAPVLLIGGIVLLLLAAGGTVKRKK